MDDSLTYPGMYQTDGCGNQLPFKGGIAWNSTNPGYIDVHVGNVSWYMLWSQMEEMYGAGWDVYNHSYSHRALVTSPSIVDTDYLYEVKQNQSYVKAKTTIEMTHFVVPSGDTNYYKAARANGFTKIYNQNYLLPGFFKGNEGLQIDAPLSTDNFYLYRENIDAAPESTTNLDNVAIRSVNGTHYWYNEFIHRINSPAGTLTGGQNFNAFKTYMSYIETTYGAKGSDRVWIAPLQEVYEYTALRDASTLSTTVEGTQATVEVDFSQIPDRIRHKAMTLVVNGGANFSAVQGAGVRIASFKGTGSTKIINLEFDQLTTLPEPTVQLVHPPKSVIGVNQGLVLNAIPTSQTGIQSVRFFVDGVESNAVQTSPYQFGWTNKVVGDHVISAMATDTLGRVSNLDTIHLHVVQVVSGTEDLPMDALKVYPNPAGMQLYVTGNVLKGIQTINVRIVDMLGRVLYENTKEPVQPDGTISLGISGLGVGGYLLWLKTDQDTREAFFTKK